MVWASDETIIMSNNASLFNDREPCIHNAYAKRASPSVGSKKRVPISYIEEVEALIEDRLPTGAWMGTCTHIFLLAPFFSFHAKFMSSNHLN